jgi:tetratricopeptide (TPR) repeat protein
VDLLLNLVRQLNFCLLKNQIEIMENRLLDLACDKNYQQILDNYQDYSLDSIAEVADFLREKGIYKVAISLYGYLLQKNETADYHFGVGQCYGKAYNYSTALQHLDKAFLLQENHSGASYYAYILEKNSYMVRAEKWYEQSLKNELDIDLWTLSHYAYFLEKCKQKLLAKSYYEKVLKLNPIHTWTIKRYSLFLLKEGQEQQSLELMESALRRFPENPFVKLNYLEYLIICNKENRYELYLKSLDYKNTPLPFQVLVDLLDYFWRYLLRGKSDTARIRDYEQKAKKLKDSIHRDFDDLNQVLTEKNGDLDQWIQLIKLLLQ